MVTWEKWVPVINRNSAYRKRFLMGTSHSWWLYFALLSNADVIPGRPPRAVFVFSWEALQWALHPSFLRHFPRKQVSFLARAGFWFF